MGTSGTIQEKYLKISPEPISVEGTKTILNQMQNFICKICGNNGTGFFCKIKNPEKNDFMNVLFTNNHVLSEQDIKDNKIINITINNDSISKNIKIDENRIRYTNKDLDVTIIEIKEEKDDIHDFLDLDEDIYKNKELLENIYGKFKKSVYVLHYPKADVVNVSYGLSAKMIDSSIYHTCSTDFG
jgi:hypothetical protein